MMILFLALSLSVASFMDVPSQTSRPDDVLPTLHAYDSPRSKEVERVCKSYLTSAIDLHFDDSKWYSIRKELSFSNGDWSQESDAASLMPFLEDSKNYSRVPTLKLSSFSFTSIGSVRSSKPMINVAGTLILGIGRESQFLDSNWPVPYSHFYPGMSQISVFVEGLYFEVERSGGSRMLCMLGTAKLPLRQGVKRHQPTLVMDGNILVTLSFPKVFSLTSREIHGEVISLKGESDPLFFSKVHISSMLRSSSSIYQFVSEELVSRACDPYPYPDEWFKGQVEAYRGNNFCDAIQHYVIGNGLVVTPNCKTCTKFGPFASSDGLKSAANGTQHGIQIVMQDVKCESEFDANDPGAVRVSAVFRAPLATDDHFFAESRTGLNAATLSVEGVWHSSSGQLCMVGCLGGTMNNDSSKCGHRVCIYVATSFSITQRSLIFGSISDRRASSNSYSPVSFKHVSSPSHINDAPDFQRMHYKYTKIQSAIAFLDRNMATDLSNIVIKPLFSYPKLEAGFNNIESISSLADELSFSVNAIFYPVDKSRPRSSEMPCVSFQILSLGSLFGRSWRMYEHDEIVSISSSSISDSSISASSMNVSSELSITATSLSNASRLFLEGVYDPIVGKMYLIGCRNIPSEIDASYEARSIELEDGMDCMIEVKIEYPSTNGRWLVNPTAKISISSQRKEDDPLHFSSFQILTSPIMYQRQMQELLSRRDLEVILHIISITLAAACMLAQLIYMRKNANAVPFISLGMLTVQAIGYSLPLITDFEATFARRPSETSKLVFDPYTNSPYKVMGSLIKLLILAAFLLTLRLIQKVWNSRIRLPTRTPREPHCVPVDRNVFLITIFIHVIGFLIIFSIFNSNARTKLFQEPGIPELVSNRVAQVWPGEENAEVGNNGRPHGWKIQVQEHIGLVQDLFLLPQIIGNVLWKIDCKPLRKVYYMGITVVRVLPHLYDIARPPIPVPFFIHGTAFVDVNLDFFSSFSDVAISALATAFVGIIYIQQRWSYGKLCRRLYSGQRKQLLPLGSTVYERLNSMSFEAELAAGINDEELQERLQRNKE